MPSKNALKKYEAGSYYHIYNRGVAKQVIFRTDKDYKTFLSFLTLYLSSPPDLNLGTNLIDGQSLHVPPSRQLKNYAQEITLLAYCLMPNHFHLFIRQESEHGIYHFMQSLTTKYVRYFNSHYDRVGHLFQDRYKAVKISSENQFTYVSKYIHLNPLSLSTYKDSPRRLRDYKYSSYGNYLHLFTQNWVSTGKILSYYSTNNPNSTYESFVEGLSLDDVEDIANITLDQEEPTKTVLVGSQTTDLGIS